MSEHSKCEHSKCALSSPEMVAFLAKAIKDVKSSHIHVEGTLKPEDFHKIQRKVATSVLLGNLRLKKANQNWFQRILRRLREVSRQGKAES